MLSDKSISFSNLNTVVYLDVVMWLIQCIIFFVCLYMVQFEAVCHHYVYIRIVKYIVMHIASGCAAPLKSKSYPSILPWSTLLDIY